jgi:UDP-N-acetylglucosamine 1-carboxyvinyltransferase
MEKFIIHGGKKLSGSVKVSGAKNSALVLMPASLLNEGVNTFTNIPKVNDIFTMKKLLAHLGAETSFEKNKIVIDTSNIVTQDAPYEHVKKMRASIYVLGPLLAKYGYAKVSLPGGCAWGPRPINLHLEAMKKFGAELDLEGGYIIAKSKKLQGAKIIFDISSVGATGNALMAAVLAKGASLISNAAIEPEVTLLAKSLEMMGAKINGIGTKTLEIEGVDELSPITCGNIDDRIEAGTLMIAAAMTKSNINLNYKNKEHLDILYDKLRESGVKIDAGDSGITVDAEDVEINPVDIATGVYPGFPTDLQAQWLAYMTLAKGNSRVTDRIYFDRFKHVPELNRLGANISLVENSALVKGVEKLKGAKVMSTDLRASASLVLAGLAAEGTTEVLRIYHLDRGYEKIEEKLQALNADIARVKTDEY